LNQYSTMITDFLITVEKRKKGSSAVRSGG